MKVLVLMSTYNGERFLAEQIESVLKQEGVTVHLLIRDDGSSDRTIPIIEGYLEKHPNISLIRGENCGCADSFMALVREAAAMDDGYDYYAFCDQDDYWEPDKLKEAVRLLSETPHSMSLLYLGAYQMVDAELNRIETRERHPAMNLAGAIVANLATGCTMVFNRELLDIVSSKAPRYMIMHDYWIYLVCLAVGGCVLYDKTPHILYRQHEKNVIGGKSDAAWKRWSVRFKKLFRKGDRFKSKLAASLLECFGDRMNEANKSFLKDVVNCRKWSAKFRLLRNPDFKGETLDNDLQIFGLVLTGKF